MPQIKQFIACKNAKTATVKPFCEIKNITDTTADLYFYGDIVSDWWGAWQEEDQYPDAIKNFLAEANGKDLNIYINSGGGSVFAGIAIYNMLKRYQGKKHCFVDALAGSIASLFPFVDSDKPTIPKNAYLMIHKPWCDCEGNANELRKMADTLEAIEAGIWSIYEEHLAEGVTIEQIKELMEAETWLSGEQAAKYFNVSVGEENTAVAAVQDYTKLYCKNTPEALAGGNPPDDTKDQAAAKEKEIRSKIAALTIQHIYPPGAYFESISLTAFCAASQSLNISGASPIVIPSNSSLMCFANIFSVSSVTHALATIPLSRRKCNIPVANVSGVMVSSAVIAVLVVSSCPAAVWASASTVAKMLSAVGFSSGSFIPVKFLFSASMFCSSLSSAA